MEFSSGRRNTFNRLFVWISTVPGWYVIMLKLGITGRSHFIRIWVYDRSDTIIQIKNLSFEIPKISESRIIFFVDVVQRQNPSEMFVDSSVLLPVRRAFKTQNLWVTIIFGANYDKM